MNASKKQRDFKIVWNMITTIGLIGCILFLIYGVKSGIFYSKDALEEFLSPFGIWAAVLFVFLQVVQVVIPILPGGISLLGGVLIFGPVMGFIYNYIGICIGSIIVFLIAKRYGNAVIDFLFKPKTREKYHRWIGHRRFDLFFALMIFSPAAPDDFLCYVAGTTKMSLSKFSTIIFIGKVLPIVIYSLGLEWIFRHVISVFA